MSVPYIRHGSLVMVCVLGAKALPTLLRCSHVSHFSPPILTRSHGSPLSPPILRRSHARTHSLRGASALRQRLRLIRQGQDEGQGEREEMKE